MGLPELLFWFAAAALAYLAAGYPVALEILCRLAVRSAPESPGDGELPHVSIILPTYNDAAHIEGKIENLLALRYPADRREIIVVSDGSTDGTADIAARYQARGVRLIRYDGRRGKPYALNSGVAEARGELLVFTDARQILEADGVERLARRFRDPVVGVVSGVLRFRTGGASPLEEGMVLYMRYEFRLRERESRIDSMLGATGALYAIRRALWSPLPEALLLDDMLIPLRIVLAGKRAVLEPRAVAFDEPTPRAGLEFRRKVRTITGNYQLLRYLPELLSPRRNRLWIQFVSHKLLRLAAPYLLALLVATSAVLRSEPFFLGLFIAQAGFYTLGVAGLLIPSGGRLRPVLAVPRAFLVMIAAAAVGAVNAAAGRWDVWVRE